MRRWLTTLLTACLLCLTGGETARATGDDSLTDSLLRRADSLPMGMERMEVLRKLVRATQMTAQGIDYARRMFREAEALHHDSLTAYSATLIANHFFAQKERDIDSLTYWTAYALPIAKRCKFSETQATEFSAQSNLTK